MEGALNYVINSFGLGIAFKWQIYLSQIILHVYNGPGAWRLHDTSQVRILASIFQINLITLLGLRFLTRMHSLVRMAYKIIILKFLFGQDCFRDHSKQIVQSTGCDSLNIELTIRAWVTQISSFSEITAFSDHAANTAIAGAQ
jgi:hypothetical protein